MGVLTRLVVAALPLVPRFLVGRVASRYVAGETLDQALEVVASLNREGAMATLDLLGEEVTEPDKAQAVTEEYLRIFTAIRERRLDANVSLKLSGLGLMIDEDLCRANVERIAAAAKEHGNFVRLDMEDRTTTDATLRIYRTLQQRYGNLGPVLQSYMRRTLDDIEDLPAEGANVRLCKGIYIEPREVAFKGYDTVRLNFLAALDKMLARGVYPAIATHDEYLVCGALALIHRYRLEPRQYEFQMLLGVDTQLRRILIARGHRMRVYVPYGRDWYPYSLRRLRENPQVATHVMRAFFSRQRNSR